MGDSVIVTLAVAVIFAIVVLALCLIGVRRMNLRRALGTIDASMCTASGRWQMGVCRFQSAELEWFRTFSLSPTPAFTFARNRVEVMGRREPTQDELAKIPPGTIVVELEVAGEPLLVAMKFEAYTGLSSWLEAGPRLGMGQWR